MRKAILFDVDATLAETKEFQRCGCNSAFVRYGIDANGSVAEYRKLRKVTGAKERLGAHFRARALAVNERDLQLLHRSKKGVLQAQNLPPGRAGVRPRVLRLIRQARRAGCLRAIAATTSLVHVDALPRRPNGSDWKPLFAAIVAGGQVPRKKPGPDVHERCLALLHLAPAQAIAIEDSPAGVAATQQAGILLLTTSSVYTSREDFSQSDVLVPDLGDPEAPWEQPVAGFSRRWVESADLQRLAARGEIAPGTEVAQ